MGLRALAGDIFHSKCKTLVNAVNCAGVMGAGIALEFKRRYPQMHREYRQLCERGEIDIGVLWIHRTPERWILNFPTKRHWRQRTKEEYLHAGLSAFMNSYLAEGVESIAFPLLGAKNGRLPPERSLEIMESYLRHCLIPVEIYTGYENVSAKDEPVS